MAHSPQVAFKQQECKYCVLPLSKTHRRADTPLRTYAGTRQLNNFWAVDLISLQLPL
jgi:hypothetical protein